ncbi:MAG: TlyA family RNA methyltransferase [Nitrospinae bacterium]|nr:TlyA family RNA methyltransferase [Nitrospinota bacterium]
MPKKRLDILLTERHLAESRQRAQALIMAGLVTVEGVLAAKAGALVDEEAAIEIKGKDHPYVSRGGVKLAHALDFFHINVEGFVCLDIGASTGGFTDCLLQRGAAKVYAVDVGENQLDYKLRSDPRVVCMEKLNAREFSPGMIPDMVDMIVSDVSFISLRLAIPPALPALKPGGFAVLLVKPQFEAGRENVGKGGIVRDEKVRQKVLEDVRTFFQTGGASTSSEAPFPLLYKEGAPQSGGGGEPNQEPSPTCHPLPPSGHSRGRNKKESARAIALPGLAYLGVTRSPIEGRKGNVEYLMGFAVLCGHQ